MYLKKHKNIYKLAIFTFAKSSNPDLFGVLLGVIGVAVAVVIGVPHASVSSSLELTISLEHEA